MYILSYEITLENIENYEIHVSPPNEKKTEELFSIATKVNERQYLLEYKGDHILCCPEYVFKGIGSIIVIPYFYTPGRRYPIQAYLYASSLYSTNTSIGQRGAAESTRVKFGLKTFSHSTLCRTFKDLEKDHENALKEHFGEKFVWNSDGGDQSGNETSKGESVDSDSEDNPNDRNKQKQPKTNKRFPTVNDTFDRRCKMSRFLCGFHRHIEEGKLDIVGRKFVKAWCDWHRRL